MSVIEHSKPLTQGIRGGLMANRDTSDEAVDGEFLQKVKQILEETATAESSQKFCPDQYVGLISSFAPGADFPERVAASQRKSTPCLLMVLESPHRAEFRQKRAGRWIDDDPGPAYGATGKSITRHLSKVIELEELSEYGLVLINAVQYQCSRATRPLDKELRDACFTRIWSHDGREDFMRRLSAVYRTRDVVINSCTTGDFKVKSDELRELVQEAIISAALEGQTYTLRSSHPASWRRADRIKKAQRLAH